MQRETWNDLAVFVAVGDGGSFTRAAAGRGGSPPAAGGRVSAGRREAWSGLAVFVAVGDGGSFTRAAAVLGVSPSAVSHAVRGSETRPGGRARHRPTRGGGAAAAG